MPRNLILYGSHGTGKTLLLVEILRMKVGYYKTNGKDVKIFIATDKSCEELRKDMRNKFNIQEILNEYGVEPKTVAKICRGMN